jgi:hypothetical protein
MKNKNLLQTITYFVTLSLFALLFISCNQPRTYSEVLSTYPSDIELCTTEVTLEDSEGAEDIKVTGGIQFEAGDSLMFSTENILEVIRCPGTKVTVNTEATLDDRVYSPGTLLTTDRHGNWIVVTSWE